MIQGWVRDTSRREPCHVQVMLDGQVVAEALANRFRADLLRIGYGHGHFGFHARLRRHLPPGPGSVLLHLPHLGASAPMHLDVPELAPASALRVEELLVDPPRWTAADLLASPACLDMEADHAQLGTHRFVDAMFRFVFSRWPTEAESRLNAGSLQAGRITPSVLLVECLGSRERADMDPRLPSPYDSVFPFRLPTDGADRP